MIPSRIVADERERASGVPDELSKLNVRVYFSRLVTGDYVLTPEIAVERKSVRDLVNSVYDARLFQQANKLSHSFSKPYLFIEGDSKEVEGLARNLKSYYGAIANVSIAYGLRILFTATPRETAIALAELLANARSRAPQQLPATPPKKPESIFEQQAFLVGALPGVGTKLAQKLLRTYGTPRRVMALTTGELASMKGIGWKRAEKISRALDSKAPVGERTLSQTRLEA